MKSTIKVAVKVAKELNQSRDNSDTKILLSTHKSKKRRVRVKMGKQSNALSLH
jgi:hypothetical protein